jgi:hypothetical protein
MSHSDPMFHWLRMTPYPWLACGSRSHVCPFY